MLFESRHYSTAAKQMITNESGGVRGCVVMATRDDRCLSSRGVPTAVSAVGIIDMLLGKGPEILNDLLLVYLLCELIKKARLSTNLQPKLSVLKNEIQRIFC